MRGWAKRLPVLLVLLLAANLLTACSLSKSAEETRFLVLAYDARLDNDKLADAISPGFEAANPGVKVKRLPLSSDKLYSFAASGGVDVILSSGGQPFFKLAGQAAQRPPFVDGQSTVSDAPLPPNTPTPYTFLFSERTVAFWDSIVLVGPSNSPLAGQNRAASKALQQLANTNAPILIPGREPAIRDLEEKLWGLVGKTDGPSRGSGYGVVDADATATLQQAQAKNAYTLVPLRTFLATKPNNLTLIVAEDAAMYVSYDAATRNPNACPSCDLTLAKAFVAYLTKADTQQKIVSTAQTRYGQPVLQPANFQVYLPK